MASHRFDLGGSQLQVGARLGKVAFILSIAIALSGNSALAATKRPSPQPTVKTSAKATVKATTKATTKATVKSTPKPTVKTSAKPTLKATSTSTATSVATVKPKPKPKPKPRKKVKVSPSPKAKWPPVGFEYESGIYAKIPTSKELVGVISAKGNLASQVAACKKFICGAVQVAAEPGCLWWEVNSKVYAQNKDPIGLLRTIAGMSLAREIKTILLISPEPLESLEYVSSIEVVCHQEAKPENTQSVTFTKIGA